MQKTKKSIAKKFKITGTGKVMLRKPGYRHFLRHKSNSRLRRAGKDVCLSNAKQAAAVRAAMPFGGF
ncbi:MAG: 50S ribosomal protein L35 [Opitutales bacterium]|nr:50S ribosomal protein L35 [Opitutales bacterium]